MEEVKENYKEEISDEIRDELEDELRDQIEDEVEEENKKWILSHHKEVSKAITSTHLAIQHLLELISKSNSIQQETEFLTEIERKQLISILEVLLLELKAPYINKSKTRTVGQYLGKLTLKGAEKELSSKIQDGLQTATSEVGNLLRTLRNYDPTDLF